MSAANRRCAAGGVIVLSLVIIADWLFYGRQIGVSMALFFVCVTAGVVAVNPSSASRFTKIAAISVLVAGLIPLCLQFSPATLLLGVMSVAIFTVMMVRPAVHWMFTIGEAFLLLLGCIWRALADVSGFVTASSNGERASTYQSAFAVWIIPIVLGAFFLFLFASANPLIEDWLSAFNPKQLVTQISVLRVLFWLAMLSLVWPFIFVARRHNLQLRTKAELESAFDQSCNDLLSPALLNSASILRSLLVFNALFAVQTVLDVTYLWGGAALPAGMSHATYAHRGAYPLIVAALLAAAFVLIAMRPGSESERSPLIRKLVYLWTAQTLLLVVSSILRLDLYVEAYSLTYWRVAAFVWMALVAVGLILIAARIMLQRSNLWLITGNGIALLLAIYMCSIVNLPSLIAHYNVAHSHDVSGSGAAFDIGYAAALGPQAIPALDLYIAKHRGWGSVVQVKAQREALFRYWMNQRQFDWRAWTYWDWRLSQYLKQHPVIAP